MNKIAEKREMARIKRNINRYKKQYGRVEMYKIMNKGASVVRKEAKRLVPVDEGDLQASIKNIRGRSKVFVGPKIGQGSHGALVEYGAIRKLRNGGISIMPAQPYMRPAFEGKKGEAISVMESEMKARHERFKST